MSFATSIHSITRPARLLQSPVFEFLIPALQNPIRKASSIAAPSSTSSPLLSHQPSPSSSPPPPRRRRSLTLAQQAFLNSAVNPPSPTPLNRKNTPTLTSPPLVAPREPSRRISRNAHLHRANSSHHQIAPAPPAPDAAHARARSRPPTHLQRPRGAPPRAPDSHVSRVESCRNGAGMGHSDDGAGSGHGVH